MEFPFAQPYNNFTHQRLQSAS